MSRVARRKVPLIAAVVVVVTALAYTFLWGRYVHHVNQWDTGLDIWGTMHAAHYIGYGDIADIYTPGTGFISTPGILVLLAPAAMIVSRFGLGESFPFVNVRPAAWFVVGPVEMAVSTIALFAFDALAEELGLSKRRRIVLTVLEAVLLWPLVAIWGHPEDPIAIAFVVYGLIYALRSRWALCGWMFGVAIAFQPVAILALPLVLAIAPDNRRRLNMVVKAAVPAALLLAIPFAYSFHNTTRALVEQPTYPSINHPTPWLAFAPVLEKNAVYSSHQEMLFKSDGRLQFHSVTVPQHTGNVVAPGLPRLLGLATAVGLGLFAWRRRPSPRMLLWLMSVALASWCFFEAVMTPYYFWSPLAMVLVAGATSKWWRWVVTAVAAGVVTRYSYLYLSEWAWWAPEMVFLGVALLAAIPGRFERHPLEASTEEVEAPRAAEAVATG